MPVAQWIRAQSFYLWCCRFESYPAHHFNQHSPKGQEGIVRFSVGEIAIYVNGSEAGFETTEEWPGYFMIHAGHECEILGSHREDDENYYDIRFSDSTEAEVHEELLRKKRPPEQKADDDFCEWFDKTINRPTEETVRRVFVDGMWGGG